MRLRERVAAALAAGRPDQAWSAAARAWAEGGLRQRHEALRQLHALAARVPEAAWTEERAALARRLEIPRVPGAAVVGRVAFPVVGGDGGRFVEARIGVRPGGDRLPPGLDAPTRAAVAAALQAARQVLGAAAPGFDLTFDSPGDAWSGDSCGLAVALAAVSAASGLALSPCLLATGRVGADGAVLPVGHVAEKLALRHAARPRGRLLVSEQDDPHLPWVVPVASLARAAQEAGQRPAVDLDQAVRAVRALDRDGRWLEAARAAEPLLEDPDLADEERLALAVVLLSAGNHAAEVGEQARWSARVEPLLQRGGVGEDLARALGARVVREVDALDPVAARAALDLSRRWPLEEPHRVHLDGPAALLATLQGEHEAALALREANLGRAEATERARCLGDLADALLRLGRADEALGRAEQGLALASEARRRHGYHQRTTAYLHLHRARALQALGRVEEARLALGPVLEVGGIDPRLRAELLRAELDVDPGAVRELARRHAALAKSSVLVRALLDRSLARLGDLAAQRALVGLAVFEGATWEEAARRLPY